MLYRGLSDTPRCWLGRLPGGQRDLHDGARFGLLVWGLVGFFVHKFNPILVPCWGLIKHDHFKSMSAFCYNEDV